MNRFGIRKQARNVAYRTVLLGITLLVALAVADCSSSPSDQVPLKIIIYTDFQCGACARFSSEVEPELRSRYADTNKAQIEIRLLAAEGDDSLRAAVAALCAGDQGRFTDYHDALFDAWRDNNEDPETFSIDKLVALATSLGLDAPAFRSCLESGHKGSQVEVNMALARADGVQTLPALLAGNARVEGYKPLDVYLNAVDQALKESRLA
ncbi:MAG: thioredoxin domain-containing protein [Dehalococcoidia bacterium]|nr:thioredoxin domain-containing protein [Dehalococcoidia bacterium]